MEGLTTIPILVRVLIDNQRALDLVNNPEYYARSKQILAKYHIIWDKIHNEKELVLNKVSSRQMGVDMLTKHASVGVVQCNEKLLGML